MFAPIGLGQGYLFDLIAEFMSRDRTMRLEWFLENGPIPFHAKGADLWICQGPVADQSLVAKPLGRMRTMFVASPTDQAKRAIGNIELIEKLGLISLDSSDHSGTRLTLPDGTPRVLASASRLITNNFPSMYRAVRLGIGYAELPLWSIDEDLSKGRLVDLVPGCKTAGVTISLVYSPKRFQSSATASFVSFLQEGITKIIGTA